MGKKVGFYSDGLKIAATVFEPDDAEDKGCPGVVLCQGMVGIKEYFWFAHVARQLADLGFVALTWDYRGVGESEGERGRLYPLEQAEDIRNALTYLEIHPKVDPERLGLAGWSFGGGMVAYVAGVDERVMCAVSVLGWGDGGRWMRSLRRHSEYLEFIERVAEDSRSRVLTGKSKLLEPGEILGRDSSSNQELQTTYRKIPGMEHFKSTPYSLATAEKLLEFKPVDVVDSISPRAILYIAAENDTGTPADETIDMYNRTKEPKKLWVIPGIGHYGVYAEPHLSQVLDMVRDWLKEHLQKGN